MEDHHQPCGDVWSEAGDLEEPLSLVEWCDLLVQNSDSAPNVSELVLV